jgi:hypothetical protein
VLALLATLGLAGCETTMVDDPVQEPERQTATFSGTLSVNGAATHRFTTTASGDITVTLKTLTPSGTPTVGLALGVWTGASCNLVITHESAAANANLIGTGTASGEFCTRIHDAGRLIAPADYTIEVTYF